MLTGATKSSQLQETSCFQNCMGTREEVVKQNLCVHLEM